MNIARLFTRNRLIVPADDRASQSSRRGFLAGSGILASTALIGSTSSVQAHHDELLTYDIACDGRTLHLNRMDAAASGLPTRGDEFIVNGKIYPGGTIEQGLTGPDQSGSIGTWVCRGWIYVVDLADPEQVPHAATTQHYWLDDGNGLVSDGLEGGVKTRRAIIGGRGRWADSFGDVTQEAVAENDTVLDFGEVQVPAPNFRFVFSLTPRS